MTSELSNPGLRTTFLHRVATAVRELAFKAQNELPSDAPPAGMRLESVALGRVTATAATIESGNKFRLRHMDAGDMVRKDLLPYSDNSLNGLGFELLEAGLPNTLRQPHIKRD